MLCGGLQAPARRSAEAIVLDVDVDAPPERRIRFDAYRITSQLVDDPPAALADLVEIAAYVYSADRLVRRGSRSSAKIGDDWSRAFRFTIPVRRPDLWNRHDVNTSLQEALSFLSQDEFSFSFVGYPRLHFRQPFLGFGDSNAQVIRPDQVILFSGGLDSLAGVSEAVASLGQRVVLVAHKSANTIAHRQDLLSEQVKRRTAGGRIFYAPVWVGRGEQEPAEHSQRLRSFLFASLGAAYAYMFGRSSVHFYENGITSFNLPVAEHVAGTRASRTTHPGVLKRFERLFSAVLEQPMTFSNPFLWKTKSDVVGVIKRNGWADLIGLTTSCANIRAYSISGQQCGSCSQCVERRIAISAQGLDEWEPDGYVRDLFVGAHDNVRDLTMIEAHVLRARELSSSSEFSFLSRHGHVFRALADLDGAPSDIARSIYRLHKRYGTEFMEVVDRELARHSSLDAILNLPDTSLAAMIRTKTIDLPGTTDPAETELSASMAAAADPKTVRRNRIVYACSEKPPQIAFLDGPVLKGSAYRVLMILIRQVHQDLDEGRGLERRRYVPSARMATELGVTLENLRQQVRRIRRTLTQGFETATGYTLDSEDVIQSINWTGYRLNPYLIQTGPSDWAEATFVTFLRRKRHVFRS